MSYLRVIPRDLFNESSLLKCLGQLALLQNGELLPKGLQLFHHEPNKGFPITMDDSDGSICCRSVYLRIHKPRRLETVVPRRGCNARDPWPLYIVAFEGDDEKEEEIAVFNDDGTLSKEFITWATTP